jgi:RNA polymerase sigma-70 factor, ECF subfamily
VVHAAVSQAPAADALLEQRRLRELLDLALDELPHDLRTTLVLFELEGFSEREIAETCAVPLGTVASRLRRARQAFHKAALRLRAGLEKSP